MHRVAHLVLADVHTEAARVGSSPADAIIMRSLWSGRDALTFIYREALNREAQGRALHACYTLSLSASIRGRGVRDRLRQRRLPPVTPRRCGADRSARHLYR